MVSMVRTRETSATQAHIKSIRCARELLLPMLLLLQLCCRLSSVGWYVASVPFSAGVVGSIAFCDGTRVN